VEHVYLGAEAIEGAPMTTQQVRVDGVDIAYTETGSGPTILFVHGVYVTGALWNEVVSELDGGFRCVVPTWPLGAHSTPTVARISAQKRPLAACALHRGT